MTISKYCAIDMLKQMSGTMIADRKVLSTLVLFIIIKKDTSAIQLGAHFCIIISSFIKKKYIQTDLSARIFILRIEWHRCDTSDLGRLKSLRVSQHAFSHYVTWNALVFMNDTCVTAFPMTTSDYFVIVINKLS